MMLSERPMHLILSIGGVQTDRQQLPGAGGRMKSRSRSVGLSWGDKNVLEPAMMIAQNLNVLNVTLKW
jgi:hypothetical protein